MKNIIYRAKVKNYHLNVTEVRDSDFKNAFSGIFNFTVGILVSRILIEPKLLIVSLDPGERGVSVYQPIMLKTLQSNSYRRSLVSVFVFVLLVSD